jgi:hypothetical protein
MMPMTLPTGRRNLSLTELRKIAADASVDPRTLQRALSGAPVRLLSLDRIRRVLTRKGLAELLTQPAAETA